jgi:Cd2+/Zn2+-exporting ATPase
MKNNAKAVSGRNKTAATTKPKEAVKTISKSAKNGHEGHNHDEHDHEGGEGHDHEHGGIFGKNTEMIFAILCGAALGAGFGLSFIHTLPSWVNLTFYIVA